MAKNAKLINRRVGKRVAYRFSIRGSAWNACKSHDMRSRGRNAFGNALWKCTHRSYTSTPLRYTRANSVILFAKPSKQVCRVYSCPVIRRTQTASQFLRAITIVDYNYATMNNVVFTRVERDASRRSLDKTATRYTPKGKGPIADSFSFFYRLTRKKRQDWIYNN